MPTPSPDIFLSYCRDDQATARLYAEALQSEGFRVWWNQSLRVGEAYHELTERALEGARAVVVLWSKKSVTSRWVRAEAKQGCAALRVTESIESPPESNVQ
ncbi:MAG: toll/interleukin-1 receptor domain-containing protein [Steroidobacteraceae bacterium]